MRATYARLVIRYRWLVVLGWVAVLVGSAALPGLGGGGGGGDLDGLVPEDDPALTAELRSFEIFGLPLLGRTIIVQHDPEGMSGFAQAEAVLRGLAITQGAYETDILGALPVPNSFGVFPGSRGEGTTVLTYVFTEPGDGFAFQERAAQDFADRFLQDPDEDYVGVTGSIPARLEQGRITEESLPLLETVTVAAIALIVGLALRSVVAPVLALVTAGTAALVTLGMVGYLGRLLGVGVPAELRPLIVALLLGVVTDYTIFFLSGLRHHLALGCDGRTAATRATEDFGPIVGVAGVTVAAGTAVLVVAQSALFRAFGPGMALTVLVGVTVAVTLVPALMAILGRFALWPLRPAPRGGQQGRTDSPPPSRFVTLLTRPLVASVVAGTTIGALVLMAVPLRDMQLGVSFTDALPSSSPVAEAAAAARDGFAEGMLSPTEVLLEAPGIGQERQALERLDALLEEQFGVAGVLGPGDLPALSTELGVLVSDSGDAVRFVVVFDEPPLSAQAISDLGSISEELPSLLEQSGLADVRVSLAGDTALSQNIVDSTSGDLWRICLAALLVNLLLLVLFLRALVAAVLLLISSVLALSASLGLTVLVFQGALDHHGMTFYVPFAAAVLLVSLGSDYNIFAVGHIWHVAERMTVREAVRVATPESTRAIVAAGFALAASFGLLGVVPLRPFRELAFALGVGIALDVLVVRALLVPTLLTLVGPASGWPWARIGVRRRGLAVTRRRRQPAES